MPPSDLRLPPDSTAYSYLTKGKQKASEQDLRTARDLSVLPDNLANAHISRSPRHRRKRSQSADLPSATSSESMSRGSSSSSSERKSIQPGSLTSTGPQSQEPCFRTRRSEKSQYSPMHMRTALPSPPTTGSASQYASLLGQPAAVSASLSSPDKRSAAAATSVLPSLYKAGRGRSVNRSPNRRWDRRGVSASANVFRGTSASDSDGGSGDAVRASIASPAPQPFIRVPKDVRSRALDARRASLTSNTDYLFSSEEEDSALPSSGDDKEEARRNNSHPRRWSSVERDRRRGLRVLLYETNVGDSPDQQMQEHHTASTVGKKAQRRLSAESDLSLGEAFECPEADATSSSSSSSSSCDIQSQFAKGESAAIQIENRSKRQSVADASGREPAASSSADASLLGLSYVTSTPSTSLLQPSPPGFIELKSVVAIPVTSDTDPLLGLTTPSIEELIQIEQVEYFPEDAIASQKASPLQKKKTATKSKTSWVIGDFESEPESEEESSAAVQHTSVPFGSSPPTPSPSSYQARLASLQSQLRIWSRGEEPSAPRTRQTSAGSDESEELRDKDSTSLLSASWRNLTRLPNLILLPGLAARQAKETLASSKTSTNQTGTAAEITSRGQDFANIFRRAAATQSPLDKASVEARRAAARKTGHPLSPSPGSSPSASHVGSRRNSNDSMTSINTTQSPMGSHLPRKGRGVATPLEADRDPSAYVSGLGQPIDPDTELSSVVHLQTFRSRSKNRAPAFTAEDSKVSHDDSAVQAAHSSRTNKSSPIQILGTTDAPSTPQKSIRSPLRITIPLQSETTPKRSGKGLFQDGPTPLDTASAPTSPTYRTSGSGSYSSDEGRTMPPTPQPSPKLDDGDGFRIVRRRNRQRLSGPRHYRPKVEAPVPSGFSAFALDESDDKNNSDSDGEQTPRTRGRRSQGRRGRDSSPPSGSRECAIGLFGGGSSSSLTTSTLSSRSRGYGGRREAAQAAGPMRSVRSSPDLTYAAAAAIAQAAADLEGQISDSDGAAGTDVSPPRGLRGRRGAVKVVASSVGQQPLAVQPLLLSGSVEGLRRGPSYPPRADQMLDDAPVAASVGLTSSRSAPPKIASTKSSHQARAAHVPRSKSSSHTSAGFGSPPLHTLRFRLLSNSSHLLMLSLELDMIKKQKISSPLKPRWGKHRANDFNPLPSPGVKEPQQQHETLSPNSGKIASTTATSSPIASPSPRWETNTRDPGSKLRFSWSLDL